MSVPLFGEMGLRCKSDEWSPWRSITSCNGKNMKYVDISINLGKSKIAAQN